MPRQRRPAVAEAVVPPLPPSPPENAPGAALVASPEPLPVPAPPESVVVDGATRWVPLEEIRLWEKNPRVNATAIPKVADSIRRFGFVAPAVVWEQEGRMVAGHTRLAALRLILASDPGFLPAGAPEGVRPGMAPVRFHPFASEAEANAYAVADNRLNELASWDAQGLAAVLGSLDASAVTVTGFDPSMFDSLALPSANPPAGPENPEAQALPDSVPPTSEHTVTGVATVKFGKLALPLTPEDVADLTAHIEGYVQRNGSMYGLVRELLDAVRS